MDIYTKLFLANLVAIIATLAIDMAFLDDALEKATIGGVLLGYWVLIGVLSIPVWLIYQIFTW